MLIALLILLPMAGGIAAGLLGRRNRRSVSRRVTAVTLGVELALSLGLLTRVGESWTLPLCGRGISFSVTGLQAVLAVLAALLWAVSGLESREELLGDHHAWRYDLFLLLTLGAIEGVFLSGDLYTTLVFFEVMSFTSFVWVIHTGTEPAKRAAGSYLTYAVAGGLVSLMGLFLLDTALGTLSFAELPTAVAAYAGNKSLIYAAGGLSMATFAAKVCMWPLHTWLPGSYTQAPAPATALLSGIVTKAGIFGIFAITGKIFLGDAAWGRVLLLLAVVTMLWGGFMALCQTNLKTLLAYSSMSQIGFMLTGIAMQALLGEEGGMAAWGSVLHLTNHAWIKLILFLAAGLLFRTVGSLELDDLRGFGRKKPQLLVIFLCPALGVMGVPLFNGYISKTLLHESIVEYIGLLEGAGQSAGLYHAAEWLFLIAGGMTVAYMTKLLVCLFWEKNESAAAQREFDRTPVNASPLVLTVLTVCALLCPVLGLTPHFTMEGIARFAQDFFSGEGPGEAVAYFSLTNLKGAAISLVIGAALYFAFVRTLVRRKTGMGVQYRNPWPAALSLEDGLYRPLLMVWLPFVGAVLARFGASIFSWLVAAGNRLLFFRASPTVTPAEDERFAKYDPDPQGRRGISGTLAFGLALFGLGYMAMMIYILVRLALG